MDGKLQITRETEGRIDEFLIEHGISKKRKAYRLLKQAIMISCENPQRGVLDICEELAADNHSTKSGVYISIIRLVRNAKLEEEECYGVKEFISLCLNSVLRYTE